MVSHANSCIMLIWVKCLIMTVKYLLCPCYNWTGAYSMAAVYNFEHHDTLDVYIAYQDSCASPVPIRLD